MEHRKQAAPQIERRYISDCEVRLKEPESRTISGYAARFGSVYNMGWFTEEVSRDAFGKTNKSDTRALFNHDVNLVLGRTKVGTARVFVDEIGLYYEADLPNTTAANDVLELIRTGNIDQSSWGFSLSDGGDRWETRDGKRHRILTDVAELYDVSPVTFPANPDTSVAKRSFEIQIQSENDQINQQTQQIEAEIGILNALFEAELIKNTL